ncbi:HAMP domain-containing histidine kinase [Myxococcota bacterium]|nr:HAMP domain-containing histidine kinase [Myxococcota bacterium]MCZ7618202.1 ATP-binding protein [Myxococcota bacterium]
MHGSRSWSRTRHRDSRRRQREQLAALREEGEQLREELTGWALHKVRGARRRLSPEDEALREARAAVARRLGFLSHAIPYAVVCVFLLFVAGFRPAMIVAMAWGVGLAIHGFFALVAPDLRKRWTEEEVGRRVPDAVAHHRTELEGRHARNLEHLSASIAHEIRNPITAAKSLLQQMGEDPHSLQNVEYASVALQELERVERSISHLLRYARDEDLRPETVSLSDVVQSGLDALRDRLDRAGVALRVDVAEAGALIADPEKLRRVVLNLLSNALDAVDGQQAPSPRIDIEAGENLAGTELWLRVRDNGPGIEPERLAAIWTPFLTSKQDGTGLGLPMVRKIVEAHGGGVEADSTIGRGAAFCVTLPKRALTEAGR